MCYRHAAFIDFIALIQRYGIVIFIVSIYIFFHSFSISLSFSFTFFYLFSFPSSRWLPVPCLNISKSGIQSLLHKKYMKLIYFLPDNTNREQMRNVFPLSTHKTDVTRNISIIFRIKLKNNNENIVNKHYV